MSNNDYVRGFSEGYEEFAEKVVIRMVTEFMRKLKELANGSDQTYAVLRETTAAVFAAHGLLDECGPEDFIDINEELMALIDKSVDEIRVRPGGSSQEVPKRKGEQK